MKRMTEYERIVATANQKCFEVLIDEIEMRLGGVTLAYVKENPNSTLRKIGWVFDEADILNMMPEKDARFMELSKVVIKQFKKLESAETIKNPKLVYGHIISIHAPRVGCDGIVKRSFSHHALHSHFREPRFLFPFFPMLSRKIFLCTSASLYKTIGASASKDFLHPIWMIFF